MKKKTKNASAWLVALIALLSGGTYYGTHTDKDVVANPTAETEVVVASDDAVETVPEGVDYSLPALRKNSGEQILHRTAMTISWNKETRTPNWVAYLLKDADMDGNLGREPEFYQDFEIAKEVRVSTYDYSHSGYDRGHMAPAGDFNGDKKAKKETFYMTNICPQNHKLNGDSWNTLEKQCRDWAYQEGGIYSVVGPIYTSANPKTIGTHKVAVPDKFFRCILSLKKGKEKAVGFIYENTGTRQRISRAACSVDEVEQLTGYDFFTALPDKLEKKLEANYNLKDWGYPEEY